jgi:hypothetical protein
MRHLLALVAALSAYAQTSEALHVTATVLSQASTKATFGPLAKQYRMASIQVCNTSAASVSVPLAAVMQVPAAIPAGMTVLPPLVALQVIAHAQGATKTAIGLRIGVAVVSGAAVATSLSGLSAAWKNGLTDTAILGSQLIPIIQQATTVQSMLNYQQATLPDPLQLVAGGCALPAVVLVEMDKSAVKADFRVSR